ncbi:MAG: glycosyltransferase family 2 protein [Peptococcaceae bacterium]|jgi:hypothetical protein|nr:glycosyltransferase family 2 protein [Peptococcaceae bacterium]MDH7525197.1 glycosyltransferase family 2 protein [Peptococcaceae bacterium]
MWTAVVPASNEEEAISQVMENLLKARIDHAVVVANGCTDRTCELAMIPAGKMTVTMINFPHALGVDVPRAVGAAFVKRLPSCGTLFVDGDMKGDIARVLVELKRGIEDGLDMALTNCYPHAGRQSCLARSVLKERERLNRRLGLFYELGLASPSHGPQALSPPLLNALPPEVIAVPPLALAFAAINRYSVGVATSIPHQLLGSLIRNDEHALLIAETIIEDCRQALSYANGESLEKVLAGKNMGGGYRPARRFDLLDLFLKGLQQLDAQ